MRRGDRDFPLKGYLGNLAVTPMLLAPAGDWRLYFASYVCFAGSNGSVSQSTEKNMHHERHLENEDFRFRSFPSCAFVPLVVKGFAN